MSHVEFGRILSHSKLHGPERMILSAIAYHCKYERNDGVAWPSIKTIAEEAGYSERQVQRVISGWINSSHEVYIIPGGGRKKSHTFIIVVGLSHAEVVGRLTEFIGLEKAVQFANGGNFPKGDTYDIPPAKRVTPTTQETQEKVTSVSPEPEVIIEPESKEVEPVSSSSPLPSESPAVTEKEEIENPLPSGENISILETERTVMRLAEIVGLNPKSAKVRSHITTAMQEIGDLDPADLECYMEYYQSQKRTLARPTLRFIVDGWTGYLDWLKTQLDRIEGHYLPGTDVYLQLSRADWQMVNELTTGERFTYRGGWHQADYIKQADGTFVAVEVEIQAS